jgi:hypothetical protein
MVVNLLLRYVSVCVTSYHSIGIDSGGKIQKQKRHLADPRTLRSTVQKNPVFLLSKYPKEKQEARKFSVKNGEKMLCGVYFREAVSRGTTRRKV